jgi:RHS repeat-associated protein
VHGNSTKLEVALARPSASLSLQLTAIDRVPTSGLVPSQAAAMTSTHLADVDGDGVSDLVTCTLDPSLQTPVWTARPWRPLGVGTEPGFALSPEPIDPLFGYPCYLRVKMVDADADGKVDLLFQHFADAGGGLVAGTTFDLLSRHSDGTWTTRETELPVPPDGASPLLLDVNGDGLPDAVESFEDGLLRTFLNTGRGFGPAHLSLLGVPQQARHFALATPIDVNADGRQDVLLPLQEADNVSPIWVVLSATGAEGDGTFAVAPSGIDATAQHTEDGIDLADRFAPRVTDVDGDGAQDLLIRRDGRFEVLRNRLGDADLLVGVTDGRNPHDPGEPAHLPTMALRYGHLHDGARTLGEAPGSAAWEAEPYLARTGFPYAPSLPAEHDAIDCLYPRVCVVGPRRVLTGYVLHNGANAPRSYSIAYRDGRYDRHGRGFLGFGARIVRDLDLGASTIELYDSVTFDPERRNYPHAGSLRGTWQISPALPEQPESPFLQASFTSILSEVVPTNDGATYHVLPSLRYQRRWEAWVPPLGVPGKTLEGFVRDVEPEDTRVLAESYLVVDAHDDHGNVTREHAWTDGVDLAVTIERAFSNDEAAWLLGRETYRMECSASAGDEPCRTTTRTYDAAGDVATETIESDDHDPETHLALEVARDAFGNVVLASAHDAYGHHRTTCASYDAEGVFPYAEGNAEAEVHYSWFDPGRGVRTAALDPNGLVTRWDYDGLGRLTREARPDGTETTFTLSRTKDGGPQHDEWTDRLRARTPGGSDDTVQYDALGRPIRWLSQNSPTYVSVGGFVAPKQRRIVREVVYDALGSHIVRRSIPFEEGTPPEDVPQHELTYDAVGRLIAHRTPWNALTRYEHDGHIHRAIDPHDHETATETDALGRPVVVLASEGASTSYSYGPFGLLASVTDAGGEVTTLDRDAYGRVRLRLDPDRGATVTHYDGFGQPRWSIDAADRVVSYGFDRVGRRIRRTDVDGTATWTWGSSVPAIGLLTKATSADGATTELKYDVSGRPTSASLTLDGETFATGATYDAQGRLDTLTYQAPGVEPLVVQRDYDPYGRLRSVRDGSTGDPYWHELDTDGAGRTAGELFGNGVTTARTYHDAKDRVESITTLAPAGVVQSLTYDYGRKRSPTRRADGLLGKVELFEHDALDRLTCSRFEDEKADCALAYAYAPNGNVTYKSDVGDYTYDPEHPHAALTAGSESFGYDEVGNQVVRPGAKITYSALDLPKRYDLDAGGTVTFDYDADGQRVRKASELAETITLGGLYERVTHYDTGVVDHRFFVRSSERVVAVVQRSLGGRSGAFYLHPDALGSIEVVTDANGTVEERRSYDAFGTRRDPSWGPAPFGPPPSSVVRSGFTGHDDDELGLVDMKGRIYDPRIARFLTTDPFVSRPLFSQAWNRYSYVENAPLSFTDPTGFQAADTTEVRWWYELPEGASSGEGVLSGPPPPEDWSAELAYDGARTAPTDAGIQGDRGADVPAGAARPEATMSLPAPLATAWEVQLGVQDATAEFARHAVMQAVVDAPSFGANNTSTLILSLVTTEPDSLPGVVGMLNPALKLTLDPLVAMGDRLEKAAAAAEQGDARGTGREATAAVLLGGVTLLGAAEGIGPLAAEARGATGAARAADGLIDPNLVRFSQDSVKSTFRNGAGVNDAIAALRGPDGASVAARFPPIRLFESEGRLFTLDNRRLLAFSMAGREVPFRMATAAEISQEGTRKLSTTAAQGWGWTITVRP